MNRISGYCNPPIGKAPDLITPTLQDNGHHHKPSQVTADEIIDMLTKETKLGVISAIPCYCDIQFSQREFLTALEFPDHPFSSQINQLIERIDKEN